MSKTAVKKAFLLLALGGATFAFAFPIIGGLGTPACTRNSDLLTFYQGAGAAAIAEFADTTRNTMPFPEGGDFDNIVVTPVQTFFTGLWNNYAAQSIPQDLDPRNVIKQ